MAVDIVRSEQKGYPPTPARTDQSLRNLETPMTARDMEAGPSLLFSLEEKRLPARLDQSLRNLKLPFLAREKEAGASILF